jgi:hypothetical protein
VVAFDLAMTATGFPIALLYGLSKETNDFAACMEPEMALGKINNANAQDLNNHS